MKVKVELPYEQARRVSYPELADQLDMLWHAMDQGSFPKAEPFFSAIKQVKDNFPKTARTGDGSEG